MKNNKTWGGRFQEATDAFVAEFNASVNFDKRLAKFDIEGSQAHALMLFEQKIISAEDYQAIKNGLEQILSEIEAGDFVWRLEFEDVHMNIEQRLTNLIGEAGKRLHTARSRNDQVATDIRLYTRAATLDIIQQLEALSRVIIDLAEREHATVMAGMTHMQSAQPVTFGHHLMAYYEMFSRDQSRFEDAMKRFNYSPLGAAALAGTSHKINRFRTAELLNFTAPCANSLDAVSDRDFAIEFCSAASLLMMHCSRLAEELILWNSTAFAFVDLPDRFCTGSSIMPQKKNPDVPELIRGKTGRVYGHLFALLTLMKSQPLAYNKDNQEDKEPLFDCVDTVQNCLQALIGLLPHLKSQKEKMRAAAADGFATATDLADYLVRKGMPFRDAHEVTGKAVALAIEKKCTLEALSLGDLQELSALIGEDIYQVLTLEGSLNSRNHFGATAPEQVLERVKSARAELA